MAVPVLPATREEIDSLGWNYVDVVIISGDAYVDHPSFGAAVIGRVLEHEGYRVAVLSRPDWRRPESVTLFGRPRLFFGVTAGNVDSTLSRYTAFNKVRNDDPYAPSGRGGMRPDRATIVYCNLIRTACKDIPVVIGGIEASMRRFAHYDFWDNRVRRSLLPDSRADLLVYGMGERAVVEIARRLEEGKGLSGIPGTVELRRNVPEGALLLPPEEEVMTDMNVYARYYRVFYTAQHRVLAMPSANRFVVQYPSLETSSEELDAVYGLPYSRRPHPSYGDEKIPAYEMIRDSITCHRGCVSGCAFCSLGLHQGKRIVARGRGSILKEAALLSAADSFKGRISDVGGPSANMYGVRCKKNWRCNRPSCVHPDLCGNLVIGTGRWMDLLAAVAAAPGIKKVTVGSGIRYDVFMRDDPSLLGELARSHVSGQLKIAPEHTAPGVLESMRKTPVYPLEEFVVAYDRTRNTRGRDTYLLPYLMSCHPACGMDEMREMRGTVMKMFHFIPRQVQAFIPLPLTLSSAVYYTGVDPLTEKRVFVERGLPARRRQHQVLTGKTR